MGAPQLYDHLKTGATTVCRAWALTRSDGLVLGFTDHDQDLTFDFITFKAETGMTARTLQQQAGLSVDNTEAIGGFSDDAITEAELAAGRYDGAKVQAWLVNWAAVSQRVLQFSGQIGEITRIDGRFSAELRSLADLLNQPRGRAYHRSCGAVLGDAQCQFAINSPNFSVQVPISAIDTQGRLVLADVTGTEAGWFSRGRLSVVTGSAAGRAAVIKLDKVSGNDRLITLWDDLGAALFPGDQVLIVAGCDKLAGTCQTKFNNFLNFRGFPHIPGEDWLLSYPVSSKKNDGGSLFK